MHTLNNDFQIIGIDAQIMLLAIFSNGFEDLIFHFARDRMFRGVHVRNLGAP